MIQKILLCTIGLTLLFAGASAQGIYQQPQEGRHPAAPQVPLQAEFAGSVVYFDNTEKYERMDRELMSFTYMHTTSTLMLKRSGRYFPQVEPVLRKYGIPDDFKYLMVIESNLDPKALSVAGAAGLWQFTKATAKEFGLVVDAEVDERYNIEKETEAACQYLQRAFALFGDWATVAASYNCGIGGMVRRVADQRQNSFFDLWLPEETSRYVYRIIAAKMMFENPEAFGFDVTERYPYEPPRQTVTVSGSIPGLVQFALDHGVTYAELKRANLWLRDDKLINKEKRTYIIAIP
ncbi:MAG: lytic transglycosylase domain-containing protein [Bacteroidales bacterium]|nr:lytic transglycosylase domain-containing protein [Bacteroidales bacterium]